MEHDPAQPTDDLAAQKAQARAAALARRGGIPAPERQRRSGALCGRLAAELSRALPSGACLAAYAALGSEVDVAPLVRAAYTCGWRVCLPCMVQDAGTGGAHMVFLQVDRAAFDAHEAPFLAKPARALAPDGPAIAAFPAVGPRSMDAVLVPMVAFDAANNRLGYGGGNYDRFLGSLREDALVLGIAFKEQQTESLPLEPHDLPLPRIALA